MFILSLAVKGPIHGCFWPQRCLQVIVGVVHQYLMNTQVLHTHRELLLQGFYSYMWDPHTSWFYCLIMDVCSLNNDVPLPSVFPLWLCLSQMCRHQDEATKRVRRSNAQHRNGHHQATVVPQLRTQDPCAVSFYVCVLVCMFLFNKMSQMFIWHTRPPLPPAVSLPF